jgi:hypothetical protein
MIAIGKSSLSIVDALKNSEVSKAIHENLSTTTHKLTLALNDPAEAHFIDIAFHLLGPEYEKLKVKAENFKNSNLKDLANV